MNNIHSLSENPAENRVFLDVANASMFRQAKEAIAVVWTALIPTVLEHNALWTGLKFPIGVTVEQMTAPV